MLSVSNNTQSNNTDPNNPRRRYEQATLAAGGVQVAEFALHSVTSMQRKQLESYIAKQYNGIYGATITNFMPSLLSMSRAGQLQAAVGVRPASDETLFLEHYLDKPIEQEIAALAKLPVDRQSVVEIGNLVATGKGGSQLLFVLMTAVLEAAGFQWFVFTATPQVEKLIKRLHFCPYPLTYADARRLDNPCCDATGSASQGESWGTYYDSRPKVMAGDIRHAMAIIRASSRLVRVVQQYHGKISSLAELLRDQRQPLCHVA
ncbi:MAG: thermostable hemolysin [Porticoccaceae bacterium]|nr:thermostable hemolysin [Porticoccaceae bacterium]